MSLEQAAEAADVEQQEMARGVLLKDEQGIVMAVLPVSHVINFHSLKELLGRTLEMSGVNGMSEQFSDCEEGSIPPFGSLFGIETIVDESLAGLSKVYFEPGSHTTLIELGGTDFGNLQKSARFASFSTSSHDLKVRQAKEQGGPIVLPEVEGLTPLAEVKKRIEGLYKLPAMPEMARRILKLRDDPNAGAKELASIVELDPSLAAQVIRYANSPLFGYAGKLDTLQEAIARVLGFEAVLNMALGLSAGGTLRNPPDGPLGLNAFWKHATYCAAACQMLAKMMPKGKRPKLGMAYLTGLLHNFGFLMLGHIFMPEFFLLNKMVAANPETPITVLEKRMIGMGDAQNVLSMGHAEVGAWLMESWEMPEELIVSMREHHNADYTSEYAVYAQLILLANTLLKGHDIGDADSDEISPAILEALGLEEDQVIEAMVEFMENSSNLDDLASQLAA
ncbi:hypothetical protein BOW53_05225 [Solemya pervernicosa gill symbiont]|uniref:HDOD domain-containing protein n=2 Tax=Gammaproteobacteria incertae sedis TaxID=118884 RepID=A0A1T2L7U0_9GAMM|nr:hypothetical protein BOW53_05225 [Solemya pervernicosa gill symbiont]